MWPSRVSLAQAEQTLQHCSDYATVWHWIWDEQNQEKAQPWSVPKWRHRQLHREYIRFLYVHRPYLFQHFSLLWKIFKWG